MAALGAYQLYWSDDLSGSPVALGGASPSGPACQQSGQYVFTCSTEKPVGARLRRVRTVHDLVEVIAGNSRSIDWVAVSAVALLCGNLIATGRWLLLLASGICGALLAVLELRAAAALGFLALVEQLLWSVWSGLVSAEWLAIVVGVVLTALALMIITEHNVREDPRAHVLVYEGPCSVATIRNDCCMDVKLLIFDGDDIVRLIPRGGLFAGVQLSRGGSHSLSDGQPHIVKAYAPWGRELGTFEVHTGCYSFRATAPPLVLNRGFPSPLFVNGTQERVLICQCGLRCWTGSLWVPGAPVLARFLWPAVTVAAGQSVPLSGPCRELQFLYAARWTVRPEWGCLLRVYDPTQGPFAQRACGVLRAGEGAEYVGPMEWSSVGTVRKSGSCLFKDIS